MWWKRIATDMQVWSNKYISGLVEKREEIKLKN